MSESDLKSYLWGGRRVEFDYGFDRYTVEMATYAYSTEFALGRKYGSGKITVKYFEELLYRHDFGSSLSEMLRSGSSFSVY